MRMNFDFSGKVVIVTGASLGIGAATARVFAEHGADVAICARRPEPLESQAARIREATGGRCLAIPTDVTDSAQVEAMVARVLEEFGHIDVLVNNAGNSVRATMKALTAEIWDYGRALNMDGAAYGTIAVGHHFLERKSGVIVNVSSTAGISGTMGEVPYSAGKAGIQMLTRVSAAEWGPHGVRVNCVAPGMIETERARNYDQKAATARFPLRRQGTSDEVAYAILFLSSDYAGFITGQTLAIDGGPVIGGFTE